MFTATISAARCCSCGEGRFAVARIARRVIAGGLIHGGGIILSLSVWSLDEFQNLCFDCFISVTIYSAFD
jgi:hypothetical protein